MSHLRTYALWYGGALGLLAIALFPILSPESLSEPFFKDVPSRFLARAVFIVLPGAAAWLMFRNHPASTRERVVLALAAVVAGAFCEQLHHQFVDKGNYFGGPTNNSIWQRQLQNQVIALDPLAIPHSYRFLAHSYLAWFEWLSGHFEFARATFRILCNALLFSAILRLGRLYLTLPGSLLLVALTTMVYPVTIAWYCGHPIDPLSHLSFIACVYFLARGFEPGIGPSLLLGVLAKESVAAVAVCRAFWGPNRLRAAILALVYLAASIGVLAWVRLFVNRGNFAYERISGVGTDHLWANLKGWHEWIPQYGCTLGVVLPGAILGWKLMSRSFQGTTLLLTAALVVSSALFSWLNEVRNLMPALVLLLIINVRYLEHRYFRPDTGKTDGPSGAFTRSHAKRQG